MNPNINELLMKRKYQIKENYFDKIDTEEKAYFMGFFYADGYNSKNGSSLVISLNIKDIDILYRFSNMILGEEHVSIYDRGPKGKEAVFRINSKDLCHRFSELGCPNCKTYTLEFPKWIDDDLLRHFVRGYFDGDGSIILSSRQAKITSSKIFNSFLKEKGAKIQ